ncbi:protein adenylyltransferase SelO family protein [Klebsiella pneumoniae]|nr:protein adenylyltransferase SelO family protein [Klebsiella pneumoniae]
MGRRSACFGHSPLAQSYSSGHQFGALGRPAGRRTRILLGEPAAGGWPLLRLHLKRRRPDSFIRGWGTAGAVLRSTIRGKSGVGGDACSGIPTTRALAMVTSDTPVYRERGSRAMLMPGGESHVRFAISNIFTIAVTAEASSNWSPLCIRTTWPAAAGLGGYNLLWFR